MSPKPKVVISLNMIRPALLGSYTTTYSEINYAVAACATAGITIHCVQLCYELNLRSNDDVFANAAAIITAMQTTATYIRTNYPTLKISVDADNWDDNNPYYSGYNSGINAMTSVNWVRQYFQFASTLSTYEANMNHVDNLPEMLDYFETTFTNGQQLRLAQSAIKSGNPMRLKVGEGLIYVKLLMKIIRQNIERANKIIDFTHFNSTRIAIHSGTIYAAFYFMKMFRGAMSNDGLIDYTLVGISGLEIIPVKTGATAAVYILNTTGDFKTINTVKLNGVTKNVTVSAYYGDPLEDQATLYSSSGAGALLYPHSLTKLLTV